jgi:hypothetical protein
MPRPRNALLDGIIGGLIGTALQTLVMWAGQRLHLLGAFPPKRITQRALAKLGRPPQDQTSQFLLTALLHLGFGMSAGAIFGLLARPLRLPWGRPLGGILFGTLVWVVSYFGWVPALRLMPEPQHDHPSTRPLVMLFNHWVYGFTLGAVVDWLQRSSHAS